jgi:hypothetical protein
MGLLSNVFGFLTGGSSAAEKVVDGVTSGIDKLVFTEEEKADYRIKGGELHLKMLEITNKESTASSVARRMICVPIVWVWLFLIIVYVVLGTLSLPVAVVQDAIETLTVPAGMALAFYVGRHAIPGKKE